MFQLEPFEWTTRLGFCERLVALLAANRVPDEVPESLDDEAALRLDQAGYAQQRLVDLITVVADRTCGPLLRGVLRWPDCGADLRNQIVYALAAAGAELPLRELGPLLDDPEINPGPLLCLCRTSTAKALAATALRRRVAREVASGDGSPLDAFAVWYPSCCWSCHPLPLQIPTEFQALRDELCDAYLKLKAPVPGGDSRDIHLYLARHRFRQAAARALLMDRWRQAADQEARRDLVSICPDPEVLADWLAVKPPPLAEVLRLLINPPMGNSEAAAEMVAAQYGEEEVLNSIEASLRRPSNSDPGVWKSAFAAEWYLCHHPGDTTDWRLGSLLTCPDIYPSFKSSLRRAFRDRLWRLTPDKAPDVLGAFLTHPDADPQFIAESINKLAFQPRPEHRELLHRILSECAAGHLNPDFRFMAVHALDQLGEDGPDWRTQLAQLAQDADLCLRLLAIRALARRGETDGLAEAVRCAWEALEPDSETFDHPHGLAVRLVGEFAPTENQAVLERLVLIGDDGRHNPTAPQEAAYALACLANPTAIVALARGYLTAERYVARAIFQYLPLALARMEGREAPLENRIPIWRYARFPP